tara:strand:+ start:242 stop:472 length:231 start_codon:yes stop_codon:yes gene_type:complete
VASIYLPHHSGSDIDSKEPISLKTDGLIAIVVAFSLQLICQQDGLLPNQLASFSAVGLAWNLLSNRNLARTLLEFN